jgi:hypothetical protein
VHRKSVARLRSPCNPPRAVSCAVTMLATQLLRVPSLLAGAIAGAIVSPWLQDPVKPAPPPAPAPVAEAPAATPPVTGAPAKAVPGKPDKNALEGVYELKRRVGPAGPETRVSRGYLAITGRYMFMCIAAEGADGTTPLVHCGVRSWQTHQERVRTVALVGWLTDRDGAIKLERRGHEELRSIEPVRGGLRVMQPDNHWLEFERVE